MEFNINNCVDVKLNEIGMTILEKRNAELRSRIPTFPEFTPPETDQNGYSRWQLWELMSQFGPHISLGSEPPFDIVILIDDVEEIATHTTPQPEGDGWVKCSERLPTESDEDCNGEIWHACDDPITHAKTEPRLKNSVAMTVFAKKCPEAHYWKPTGLTRPQPPTNQESGE